MVTRLDGGSGHRDSGGHKGLGGGEGSDWSIYGGLERRQWLNGGEGVAGCSFGRRGCCTAEHWG